MSFASTPTTETPNLVNRRRGKPSPKNQNNANVSSATSTATDHRRKSVAAACQEAFGDAMSEIEKRAETVRDVVASELGKLEKRTEACREAVAGEFEKLERRAEHCRHVVVEEIEKWSIWAYRDQTGEEWDAQPACFITNYVLAVQSYCFALYIWMYAFAENSASLWYCLYFIGLGTSATFGGVLHHVAFEALNDLATEKKKSLVKKARVFGFHLHRDSVDRIIEVMWRIVLGASILSNFALLSLAVSRYMSDAWVYTIIISAGLCYFALGVWATMSMHVVFLMVGFTPTLLFGAINSLMAFDWQWGSHSSHELVAYVLTLAGGLIQGLVVSPSQKLFNHNALSHVALIVAATFMLAHFEL